MKKLITVALLLLSFSLPLSVVQAAEESVNVNKADIQVLADVLVGVGLKRAEAIVAWRESNGDFTSVEALLEVKGIGERLLAKNQDRIVLE